MEENKLEDISNNNTSLYSNIEKKKITDISNGKKKINEKDELDIYMIQKNNIQKNNNEKVEKNSSEEEKSNSTEQEKINTTEQEKINTTEQEKINTTEQEKINTTEQEKPTTWNSISSYFWSWFEPVAAENQENTTTNSNITNNNNNDSNRNSNSNSNNTINDENQSDKKKLIILNSQQRTQTINLVNRDEDVEQIVTPALTEYIRPHLPTFQRESVTWTLRYSIEQHGVSLNTLYSNVKDCGPLILAIRDNYNNVFGAYTSEEFHIQNGYFGTRECFLWKSVKGGLKMYPSSGENEYFILCENDFIALGGGDGKFGLYIDEEIQNGHSAECTAFFSEGLSSSFNFQIIGLEVWSFEI